MGFHLSFYNAILRGREGVGGKGGGRGFNQLDKASYQCGVVAVWFAEVKSIHGI